MSLTSRVNLCVCDCPYQQIGKASYGDGTSTYQLDPTWLTKTASVKMGSGNIWDGLIRATAEAMVSCDVFMAQGWRRARDVTPDIGAPKVGVHGIRAGSVMLVPWSEKSSNA